MSSITTLILSSLISAIPKAVATYNAVKTQRAAAIESGVFSVESLDLFNNTVLSAGATLTELAAAARSARAADHEVPGIEELEALADEVAAMPDRTQDWE